MTEPKKTTKAKTKDAAKQESATAAPYLKKDNTSEADQDESVKSGTSKVLILSLLLIAIVIVPITIYKFNEQLTSLSSKKVDQASTQTNLDNTGTTSATIAPTSTDNNDTNMQSTQVPETVVNNKTVLNNNEVIQQRRQAYANEMQSRQEQHQAMMTARQQEMAKAAEARKEKYKQFRQEQEETKVEIQKVRKQIYQLNERLRHLMQKTYPRNNN